MLASLSDERLPETVPVIEFLGCRTPDAWVTRAMAEIPILLLDHASLELRAAQQAQKLIRRYGAASSRRSSADASGFGLLNKMSRLAREELRHFEQVIAILEKRRIAYRPVSASRYAAALHAHVRPLEPDRLLDTLIVGAFIEARSCERFYCLWLSLESAEPELARFYGSLLRSEARHFLDYLRLGETLAGESMAERAEFFRQRERELVLGTDPEIRLHSGVPAESIVEVSSETR